MEQPSSLPPGSRTERLETAARSSHSTSDGSRNFAPGHRATRYVNGHADRTGEVEIGQRWAVALGATHGDGALVGYFAELAERLLRAVRSESSALVRAATAEDVGAAMVAAHLTETETLGRSVAFLGAELDARLSGQEPARGRLWLLLGSFADGYVRALRARTLAGYEPGRSSDQPSADPDRDAARYALAESMPGALERGEFFVEYQPIAGLTNGEVRGVEALVRWRHPQLGVLGPNTFIGIAEYTGHIVPLGRWVLEEACREAATWGSVTPNPPFVSVNVAARQMDGPGLIDDVPAILARTGLPAHRLQLELTESALMGVAPARTLEALAAFGVRIAIDDFGTGYSNLAYLRRLPVHGLKLAGPFVTQLRAVAAERSASDSSAALATGPDAELTPGAGGNGGAGEAARTLRNVDPAEVDAQIVEAVVRLARTLGLTITAECVETDGQASRLRDLGCDLAQGWLFGASMTGEDLCRLMAQPPAPEVPVPASRP